MAEDNYIVRRLVKDDWEIFRAIRLEALKKYPHVYFGDYKEETKREDKYWQDKFDPKNGCLFGLFDGDKFIGIAGLFHEDGAGVMGAVYVKPDYQKRGLATLLGKACIDWSIDFDEWKTLSVAYRVSNEASRRFIEGLGFSYFKTLKSKEYPNGDVEDENRCQIDLEELRHLIFASRSTGHAS